MSFPLQGKDKNILEVTDKILGFVQKIRLLQQHVEKSNLEMFPLLHKFCLDNELEADLVKISEHLKLLSDQFESYFKEFSTNNYDWIWNPFEKDRPVNESLTFAQSEELSELSCSKSLEHQFRGDILDITKIWISAIGQSRHKNSDPLCNNVSVWSNFFGCYCTKN